MESCVKSMCGLFGQSRKVMDSPVNVWCRRIWIGSHGKDSNGRVSRGKAVMERRGIERKGSSWMGSAVLDRNVTAG